MSARLHIQLSESAKQIVAGLQTLPQRALAAIARGMDQQNQLTISKIQRDHLTGQGPFPPEEHKLGVRTSRLRGSVNATASVINGDDKVVSGIGSNVIYAAIHEFGGRIHKAERQTKVRLRTDARGNLLHRKGSPNLAIFAKASHKRAKTVEATVGAHDIDMPERAPFRTGIEESATGYRDKLSAAILKEMRGTA